MSLYWWGHLTSHCFYRNSQLTKEIDPLRNEARFDKRHLIKQSTIHCFVAEISKKLLGEPIDTSQIGKDLSALNRL